MPVFLSYVLSFVYLGIYWNNHHHLLQAARHVDGGILWANLHLLFWLSLFPFVTGWMGENDFAAWPVALYGVVLLLAGLRVLAPRPRPHRPARRGLGAGRAIGNDFKGNISLVAYVFAIPLAFVNPGSPAPSTSPSRSSGWSRTAASSGRWPTGRSSDPDAPHGFRAPRGDGSRGGSSARRWARRPPR